MFSIVDIILQEGRRADIICHCCGTFYSFFFPTIIRVCFKAEI